MRIDSEWSGLACQRRPAGPRDDSFARRNHRFYPVFTRMPCSATASLIGCVARGYGAGAAGCCSAGTTFFRECRLNLEPEALEPVGCEAVPCKLCSGG